MKALCLVGRTTRPTATSFLAGRQALHVRWCRFPASPEKLHGLDGRRPAGRQMGSNPLAPAGMRIAVTATLTDTDSPSRHTCLSPPTAPYSGSGVYPLRAL